MIILLLEGPQDKKESLDFYYDAYSPAFEPGDEIKARLASHLEFLTEALPNLAALKLRSKTSFYSLIGALDLVADVDEDYNHLDKREIGDRLTKFSHALEKQDPPEEVERYVFASSRQTDNLIPRQTRIDILKQVIVPEK